MNKKQLANLYGITPKTFGRWMKRLGIAPYTGRIYTPNQVETIFSELGKPENA